MSPSPERFPDRFVAFERAVLRVDVRDAFDVEQAVTGGERLLARDVSVGRIPHGLQIGMIDGSQHAGHFLRGRDIARVVVFEADDQAAAGGFIGEVLKKIDDPLENLFRLGDAAVREHANDLRARPFRDLEGALGELEAGCSSPSLPLSNGEAMETTSRLFFAQDRERAVEFLVGGFENVTAGDGAKLGAPQAQLAHDRRGGGDVRRKHVGDSANGKSLHQSFIRSSLR